MRTKKLTGLAAWLPTAKESKDFWTWDKPEEYKAGWYAGRRELRDFYKTLSLVERLRRAWENEL